MTVEQAYPKKLYYSISEVAQIAGVKPHVLRYWESEFPSLRPRKTRSGSRRYRPADIDEILHIKDLLYVQGFKIAGARKALREGRAGEPEPAAAVAQMSLSFSAMSEAEKLAFIKAELGELLALIRSLGAKPGESATEAPRTRTKRMEAKG